MVKAATPKQLAFYRNDKGNEPFIDWLDALRDQDGRRRILVRLRRLEQGNYGDCSPIGEGLSKLRCFLVPATVFTLEKMQGISSSYYVAAIKAAKAKTLHMQNPVGRST